MPRNLHGLLETGALKSSKDKAEGESVEGTTNGLVQAELYYRVLDGELGLEKSVGFLFSVELLFIILGGSLESSRGRNQVRGGEALLKECLPVKD